ncbi:hypothetical protein [Clostridium sp. AN503]|uniref:hypothetical protein n=1 Tax=Clostridium sp. AN503 TaxID=3160598 RepID=UPI00345A9F84
MVRKICPICDQVMGASHYCKNCKSWVKHPYVRDVTYYLNERHPANESDCSYHAGLAPVAGKSAPAAGKNSGSWTPNGDRPSGGNGSSPTGSWQPQGARSTQGQTGRTGKPPAPVRQERPKVPMSAGAKKNTGALVVVIVLVVIKLLGSCASMGMEAFNTVMPKSPEPQYDVDLGDFYGEEETWDADYIELDADEVIAAGVECSREYHFAVSGTAMEQPLAEILNRHGLDMTGSNTYSYNEQYDNGDTWYVTWTVYDLNDGENGAYQYAELDYDTATEALHQIDITLEDPQVLGDVSGEVLEMLEESGALLPGENCAELLSEEMPGLLIQDGSYELQSGALSVDGYYEGDHYVVSIYRIEE